MAETSTKPYMVRALHEWCTDNGYTPYIAVRVDSRTRVPQQFVSNGEIVLNVSYDATGQLQMNNDWIEFNARFGGTPYKLEIPISNVLAIYARENGQGMAFPVEEGEAGNEADAHLDDGPAATVPAERTTTHLAEVPGTGDTTESDAGGEAQAGGEPARPGGRPHLKVIK